MPWALANSRAPLWNPVAATTTPFWAPVDWSLVSSTWTSLMMLLALGEELVGGGRQQVGEVGAVIAVTRSASGLPQRLELAVVAVEAGQQDALVGVEDRSRSASGREASRR
jgi:hypothetical protein